MCVWGTVVCMYHKICVCVFVIVCSVRVIEIVCLLVSFATCHIECVFVTCCVTCMYHKECVCLIFTEVCTMCVFSCVIELVQIHSLSFPAGETTDPSYPHCKVSVRVYVSGDCTRTADQP